MCALVKNDDIRKGLDVDRDDFPTQEGWSSPPRRGLSSVGLLGLGISIPTARLPDPR